MRESEGDGREKKQKSLATTLFARRRRLAPFGLRFVPSSRARHNTPPPSVYLYTPVVVVVGVTLLAVAGGGGGGGRLSATTIPARPPPYNIIFSAVVVVDMSSSWSSCLFRPAKIEYIQTNYVKTNPRKRKTGVVVARPRIVIRRLET